MQRKFNNKSNSLKEIELLVSQYKPLTSEDIEDKYNDKDRVKILDLATKACAYKSDESLDTKFKILELLTTFDDFTTVEVLSIWRDSLNFLKDEELNSYINLLIKTSSLTSLDSHERIYTAVCFYNMGFIDICYECFLNVATDKSVLIKHRLEAIRFLFGSEDERETARKLLIEIITDLSLPSQFRYETIASYISKTGIVSLINTQKLKIPYDEEFVSSLQFPFFYEVKNEVRYRLLSGQHLLQMSDVTVPNDKKLEISDKIIEIANTSSHDENTRADAADIILRLGSPENRRIARTIITNLGYSADGEKKKFGVKTLYDDSQNVHNSVINEQVEAFLTKILDSSKEQVNPMKNFKEVHQEISKKIREIKEYEQKTRNTVYRTLSRISVDTASFTHYNATLAEILCHVWTRIHSSEYDADTQKLLELRLFDELSDMSDTCSSGHASRFVNVFSTVDQTFSISWEDQIKANLKGRVEARLRDCKDEEIQSAISMAFMDDADENDKAIYQKFINEVLYELEGDLYEEFVEEGYIKESDFDEYFSKAKSEWVK